MAGIALNSQLVGGVGEDMEGAAEVLMGWPGLGVPIPLCLHRPFSPGPSQLQGALGIRIPGLAGTSQ